MYPIGEKEDDLRWKLDFPVGEAYFTPTHLCHLSSSRSSHYNNRAVRVLTLPKLCLHRYRAHVDGTGRK